MPSRGAPANVGITKLSVQTTDLLSVQNTGMLFAQTTEMSSVQTEELFSVQTTDLLSVQTKALLSVQTTDLVSVQTTNLVSAQTRDSAVCTFGLLGLTMEPGRLMLCLRPINLSWRVDLAPALAKSTWLKYESAWLHGRGHCGQWRH